MKSIAFFITPHGFGHAARSCAIMSELKELYQDIKVLIFTTVPKAFFQDSLEGGFYYYSVLTDVGFVQKSSLEPDMYWTVEALKDLYPVDLQRFKGVLEILERWNARIIVSDISPLGILLGKRLQIKTLLVENFTWDWIYSFYGGSVPQLGEFIPFLSESYGMADYRIRTVPYCGEVNADLIVPPVSRRVRKKKEEVRVALNIGKGQRMILLTMGGVSEELGSIAKGLMEFLEAYGVVLVCPSDVIYTRRVGNIIYLPKFSEFFHPDLINASDGVIGKLGYGTLAEVANLGVPYAFVMREGYPETDHMKGYALSLGNTLEVSRQEFQEGRLRDKIEALLGMERMERGWENGAIASARFLLGLLESQ